MTKEYAVENMSKPKTMDEWLAFEKEFYETISEEDRDDIGALAMPMVEACGLIRSIRGIEEPD